jgi:YidC/Oxa1 family membrane protein insertase
LPAANVAAGAVSTADLFFEAEKSENAIVFRARAANGGFFEQRYVIQPGSYLIDYSVRVSNMEGVIPPGADAIRLNWVNYLDRLEKNTNYERQYSTIYFKTLENGVDYTSATRNTQKEVGKALRWISHSNQFFNSTLIAQDRFQSANLEVQVFDLDNEDLKRLRTILSIPYDQVSSGAFAMQWYVGPNEFSRLREIGARVEDIIPFGWSIFGTINRWVIRPLFNFLSNFIPSKGLVILALTLIVKMLLFPLTYRMLYSQSKMAALKPQLERLREKHKDDPQQQQLEQMKIYREFGVNPLGGCMPMLLQMPIWFALYRFFPAAFEFRQAGFLWATDLSSYDVFARLPFEIPFGFGAHVSLFTLLWALTTLLYTWYNMRHIDMGGMAANPALKYMQYIMPILFMGFFNSFASGLTAYLLFSNLVNIGQTVVTKNFIIDQEKIKRELEAYRKKPKKKGGFQQRLEAALKEQQRIQSERDAAAKKKRKT